MSDAAVDATTLCLFDVDGTLTAARQVPGPVDGGSGLPEPDETEPSNDSLASGSASCPSRCRVTLVPGGFKAAEMRIKMW